MNFTDIALILLGIATFMLAGGVIAFIIIEYKKDKNLVLDWSNVSTDKTKKEEGSSDPYTRSGFKRSTGGKISSSFDFPLIFSPKMEKKPPYYAHALRARDIIEDILQMEKVNEKSMVKEYIVLVNTATVLEHFITHIYEPFHDDLKTYIFNISVTIEHIFHYTSTIYGSNLDLDAISKEIKQLDKNTILLNKILEKYKDKQ